MKKLEVVVTSGIEEEIGRELLSCVYGVIQKYGYADYQVSVRLDTVPEGSMEIQVPGFLRQQGRRMKEGRA